MSHWNEVLFSIDYKLSKGSLTADLNEKDGALRNFCGAWKIVEWSKKAPKI